MIKDLTVANESNGLDSSSQNNMGFMTIKSFEDAFKYAELISKTPFCPKEFMGNPGNVLVAMQYGLELGLKPIQSLQNICVINGKPSIYGDAMLAICMASPEFEYIDETFDEKTQTATCKIKSKRGPEQVRTFSLQDAKVAGLFGKSGPWVTYPKRMCQMRARSTALRDKFAHLLKGFVSVEEANDYPSVEVSQIHQDPKVLAPDFIEHTSTVVSFKESDPKVLTEKIGILEALIKLASQDPESTMKAILEKESVSCLTEIRYSEILDKWISIIERKMSTPNESA